MAQESQAQENQAQRDQVEERRAIRAAAREGALHDRHGAFISVADSVDVEAGAPDRAGPLSDVAFAVKDNIDTRDLPTTGGTEALRYSKPSRDAEVVARLAGAGAFLVGKTNLHELAFGITGDNGSFGAVLNPHNTDRSAGGSSSGSAAAVALGIVPVALGTDTGGSIRIPAAHCGVVGMRPTTGRYPMGGVIGLSRTRDTIGVIAATVAQVALIDGVITGQAEYSERDLSGARMGWPADGFLDDVDPEVLSAMTRVHTILEEAGVTLVEVSTEQLLRIDAECGFPITFYESGDEIMRYVSGLAEPFRSLSLADIAASSRSPDVHEILVQLIEEPVSGTIYAKALQRRSDLRQVYADLFSDHEIGALLYPTVAILPPEHGERRITDLNGRRVPVFETSIRNTSPGSVAGTPSISIPAGRSTSGLPIGLSLESGVQTDRALLGMAGSVMRALNRAGL